MYFIFHFKKNSKYKNLNKTLRVISVDFMEKLFLKLCIKTLLNHQRLPQKRQIIRLVYLTKQCLYRQDYDLWIRMSKLGNFHGISKPLTSYTVFNDLSQVSSKYKNHIFAARLFLNTQN